LALKETDFLDLKGFDMIEGLDEQLLKTSATTGNTAGRRRIDMGYNKRVKANGL